MALMNREMESRFVAFVGAVFTSHGFVVERGIVGADNGADLIARRGEESLIIEVKAYRSSGISFSSLRNAALQLKASQSRLKGSSALLATNVTVRPEFQHRLLMEFGVAVYGRLELMALVMQSPRLQSEFDLLLREMFTFEVNSGRDVNSSESSEGPTGERQNEVFDDDGESGDPHAQGSSETIDSRRGAALCQRLRQIIPGRAQAADFESICEESLKYLFGDHLVGWNRQSPTVTGLHIFDLIARISSENSFWLTLSQQFKTRNPVFEFKNYTEPITQAQVYTTEKYLYPAALRGTAIIIAREGANSNAHEAIRGALRETGKLILVLSMPDVCTMLHAKDSGGEPSDYLAERLDQMLFHLDR